MKCLKSFLLVAVTLFSTMNLSASSDPTTTVATEIRTMLQSTLSDIEIKEDTKVFITFMLNESNEVIVLSTNNDKLDDTIKRLLNYKEINATNLEKGKKYTLPVLMVMK